LQTRNEGGEMAWPDKLQPLSIVGGPSPQRGPK
jgi:hypothetical protein